MKKGEIMNSFTRTFSRVGFKFKKHSPEILIVAGVTGVAVSAVMACVATTKVSSILEETKDAVDTIHEMMEKSDKQEGYTEQDSKKDLAIVYTKTAVSLAKLYAPSVILGLASIGCILASHNIIRQRNVALAAAYATVDKGFKEYRGRVIERFGKELDRELKYNIKAKEIEEVSVDEKGKEKVTKQTIGVADPNSYSPYSIFFDDGNAGWDKDPEVSKFFLIQQQNYANELLKSKGHLFLNEVYDMLGAMRTKAGQCVGWIYDEAHPVGDNFVDFGIFDVNRPNARDFVNGYERVILLDFNVDGNILDLI